MKSTKKFEKIQVNSRYIVAATFNDARYVSDKLLPLHTKDNLKIACESEPCTESNLRSGIRVAVAMSGGMDSAAAALLLLRAGYEVVGLHMRLDPDSDRSWNEASKTAAEIGVPLQLVDLSREFSELVIKPFIDEYAAGRTPSPCPRCNHFIKTGLLLEEAERLGLNYLATGHYARIVEKDHRPTLVKGIDKKKDQSYFLFMIRQERLGRLLFPLGDLTKQQVRELLRREHISAWKAEESQELCFIPTGDYRSFLARHGVNSKPGLIVDTRGNVLGKHAGIQGYTVGQRRGLGVCGPEPYYVIRIDAPTNTVVIGTRDESLCAVFSMRGINISAWNAPLPGDSFQVKVRSAGKAVPCTIADVSSARMEIRFDEPQTGVAPGQAGVLYQGETVIGGGWIEETWR